MVSGEIPDSSTVNLVSEIMCKWLDYECEEEYDEDGNPDGWNIAETICLLTKECYPDCPCEKYEPGD